MAFASPVKQMIFALKNMANFSEIENSNVWPDINADFVESLLLEASKLADSTIAPLNHIGDKVGSKLEGADVITPPGFKDAYIKFIESSSRNLGTINNDIPLFPLGDPSILARTR